MINKPWGYYENLYTEDKFQIKKIVIEKNQSPSYQYHHRRKEIWIVISGKGTLTLNDEEHSMNVGDIFEINPLDKHRPKCISEDNLVFVEIQTGESFDENDIVRLADIYGRT